MIGNVKLNSSEKDGVKGDFGEADEINFGSPRSDIGVIDSINFAEDEVFFDEFLVVWISYLKTVEDDFGSVRRVNIHSGKFRVIVVHM